MSLPVPSGYSAQLLLSLWLGFLFVVVLGYWLVRWGRTLKRKVQAKAPVYERNKPRKRASDRRKRRG